MSWDPYWLNPPDGATRERLLQTLLENLREVYFRVDAVGNVIAISPSAIKALGYDHPSEILGHPIASFYADPTERPLLLKELATRGRVEQRPLRLRKRDGESLACEVTCWVVQGPDGSGSEGVIQDASARLRAEDERMRKERDLAVVAQGLDRIQRLAHIAGLTWDRNSQLWTPSENFWDVLGSRPANTDPDSLRQWLARQVHGEDQEVLLIFANALMGLQISQRSLHFRCFDSIGHLRHIACRTEILFQEGEIPDRITITLQDVTTSRLREADLERSRDQAREADRLKTSFLANISHEMRTPLNGILGFSQLLRTDGDNSRRAEYLHILEGSARHLLRVINDLIDISRLEAGQLRIHRECLNLHPFLRDLAAHWTALLPSMGRAQIGLHLHKPPESTPLILQCDSTRLTQVFNNLIENAIKFTPSGEVRFGCEEKICDGQLKLRFFVEDTGIGIPPEFRELIFERFQQLDNGAARKQGGVGLGLAIARGIIEILGGNLLLAPQRSTGACFEFSLPWNRPGDIPNPQPIEGSAPQLLGKTLLIVEDDQASHLYLKALLRPTGAQLLSAYDGEEAVAICQSVGDVDLVLMDLHLPRMHGIHAAIEIHKNHPLAILVAQTANALATQHSEFERAQFKAILTKPVEIGAIYRLLQQLLPSTLKLGRAPQE